MPPRGPLQLTLMDAQRLLILLRASENRDWKTLIDHLNLAIAMNPVIILLKDYEAEGLLDLIDQNDSLRKIVAACLDKMMGRS